MPGLRLDVLVWVLGHRPRCPRGGVGFAARGSRSRTSAGSWCTALHRRAPTGSLSIGVA